MSKRKIVIRRGRTVYVFFKANIRSDI